jgi:hypothetical protein
MKLGIVVAAVLAVSGCAQQSGPAVSRDGLVGTPSVAPTQYPNSESDLTNPTCADLGYAHSYKIDDVNGPFTGSFTSSDGYLVVQGTSLDGVYFSFTSNVGVDLVIVKGGHAANVYAYNPESTGDSGLVSPINASGGAAAISHVTFCYDYEVRVAKTASTSFTRDFQWSLDKSSTTSELLLSVGQVQVTPYTVVVSTTGFSDSNFAVAGTITVTNPAPIAATIANVSDVMAPVDCGQAFPFVLPAGASVTCTYASALPDASSRTNVATVATIGEVGGNTASAAVDFATAAITTVDDCVTVTDSMVGSLGTVCRANAPQTFQYTAEIGPFTADGCGVAGTVNNVATFTAGSGEQGSDTVGVSVTVACPQLGCTLTQGYWKTHSSYGPARYDDTWALLPQGADTAFFNSGLSWYSMFRTAPQGNSYWQLAHQYAAATLNGLNGADTSVVAAQLAAAQAILSSNTPSNFPKATARTATQLAAALDAYNNGLTGPGHCSE